jgi:CHAT domain-containing protein/Flp pilus assembly protein TadD
MNPSRSILACLLIAFANAENRRPEIDTLLSAYQLAEADRISTAWLAQEEQNGEGPDLAGALESSAMVRLLKGEPVAQARALAERALAIRTRINDPSRARSINLLGAVAFRATDYRGAVAEYQRALALQSADTLLLADTLAGLGQATGFGGDPRSGLTFVKRALAIREAQAGPRQITIAETLNLMGTLSYQANEIAHAEEYFLKARGIVEELSGPDHFLAAQIDGGLATLYKEKGQFSKARVLHEHVVRVFEAVLGPDHPRLVIQYNNLGLCLKELGDLQGARTALERALQISVKANGPESPTTASVLGNLGIALKESGDYQAARDAYERALAIQEKRLGPEHQLVGAILFSLGSLLADMGDAASGRKYLERALAITDKALGKGSVRGVQIMDQLGSLLTGQKDLKAARAIFQRAWEESRDVYGEGNTRTASALASLAGSYGDMGDFAGARERYRQALAIEEKELGPAHYYTLEILYSWARTEQAAGEHQAALALYNRVSAEWRKQFGAIYPSLAESLGHGAECLDRLGRRDEALKAALESASIRRTNLEIATHATGEREALLYAAKERTGLNLALRLAASGSLPADSVRDVWDAVIRERALVLDEMSERHAALDAGKSAETSALVAQVTAAHNELARAVVRGPESNLSDYATLLEALRSRADQLERQLALRSKRFDEHLAQTRRGFDELRASLPEHTALIAYARYPTGYVAFVLRAGENAPRSIPLGKAASIDANVARWRVEIDRERDSMGRAATTNEAAYRTAGTALRRAIWDPVSKLVANTKATYIVADGAIQLVNFLSLPSGTASYLIESGREIRLVSTEKEVAAPHETAGGTFLAIGGPAFDAAQGTKVSRMRSPPSGCDAVSKMTFPPLPGSGEEAQEVARIGRQYGFETVILRGENATEAAFKNMTSGKAMIHVATHGFFIGSRCLAETESPLLRAGLAFAGANRHSSTNGHEDGILTAEEVASLDLEKADWVVLSGCDTGVGELQTGEGVLGLRRAFRIAGARSLVMSLWPVDDQETRRWMIDLYKAHLGRKLSATASVRLASEHQLLTRRAAGQSTHPFYWAGFIAVGN